MPATRTFGCTFIEGLFPTLEAGLKDGTVDFYIGPQPEFPVPPELILQKLFANTRKILCRKGHPLETAKSLKDLTEAEWVFTSITISAEDELGEVFAREGLPPPRLVLKTQSALTLILALAHTDLLAMAPIQWKKFAPTAGMLDFIDVVEVLPAPAIVLIRRAGLPLTPAVIYLAELLRSRAPRTASDLAA